MYILSITKSQRSWVTCTRPHRNEGEIFSVVCYLTLGAWHVSDQLCQALACHWSSQGPWTFAYAVRLQAFQPFVVFALPWLNSTHPNFLYIMQTFPLWNFVPVFSELQVYSNKGGKEGLRWMSPFCSILSHTGLFLFLKPTKLFPTSRPSSPLHSLCLSNSHPWYFGWNITSSGRFSLRSLQLMFSSGLVYFFHQP